MYVLHADEMKSLDFSTINDYKIPSVILMEWAAKAAYDYVVDNYTSSDRILITCGSGNNGADGLCLARQLKVHGYFPLVFLMGNEGSITDESRLHLDSLLSLGVECYKISGETAGETLKKFKKYAKFCDVIVDAIFGISLNREVEGCYKDVIQIINASKKPVISLDMPSGICADTGRVMGVAVKAKATITFAYPKLGLYLYPGAAYSGNIMISDIGIPKKAERSLKLSTRLIDEESFKNLPPRRRDGHKGTFGRVLVIAGSSDMAGAAALSAKAAYRMGAGLVYVFTEDAAAPIVLNYVPEAICYTYSSDSNRRDLELNLIELLSKVDAILIGPGMLENEISSDILTTGIASDKPLVIDAGALNILAEDRELMKKLKERTAYTVITPHLGEMSKLSITSVQDISENIMGFARNFVDENGLVLCLKSARSILAFPDSESYLNVLGNDGMATAGSGDVLSGAIVALLAQHEEKFFKEALCKAVYSHSVAGDKACESGGKDRVMASDLIDNL